jgi:cell division protein FtsX
VTDRRLFLVTLVLLVGAVLAVVFSGTEVAGRPTAKRYDTQGATSSEVCRSQGGQVQVRVYFALADTDANMRAAGEELRDDPRIAVIEQETQAEAYERFKEIFADQPELLEVAEPDSLPASLAIVPVGVTPEELAAALREELSGAGVDDVNAEGCWLPN